MIIESGCVKKIIKNLLFFSLTFCMGTSVHSAAAPDQGRTVDCAGSDGYPAAGPSKKEHKVIVDTLIKDKGSVNEAFYYAADQGLVWALDSFIKKGARVDVINRHRETALHLATKKGNYQTVQFLIHAGIAVNAVDKHGKTALHEAAERGFEEIVIFLVKEGRAAVDVVTERQGTALTQAASQGHLKIVQFLMQAGASAEWNNWEVLRSVVENGHLEIVQNLLQAGADKDATGADRITPLHLAVKKGHPKIVQLLLQAGANKNAVTKNGKTALHMAAIKGNQELVQMLLQAGAKIDIAYKRNDEFEEHSLENRNRTALDEIIHWRNALIAEMAGYVSWSDRNTVFKPKNSKHFRVLVEMLINGYRAQLDREYPTKMKLSEEELESLKHWGSLPSNVIDIAIVDLPEGDLRDKVTSMRFPAIKKDKFKEFIKSPLENLYTADKKVIEPLFMKELAKGYEVETKRRWLPAFFSRPLAVPESQNFEKGHSASAGRAVASSKKKMKKKNMAAPAAIATTISYNEHDAAQAPDKDSEYRVERVNQTDTDRIHTDRSGSGSVDLDCPHYSDAIAQDMASGSDDAGRPNYSRCPSCSSLSSSSSD